MRSRGVWITLSLITGSLMIALGVLFLARPALSLASVILLVGTFAIVYGVALVISGLTGRAESRGWALLVGLLAVIMGIVTLAWPGATSLAVLYIIAAWAIISGVADIGGAFARGFRRGQRIWLVLAGLLGIVFGVILFVHPVTGVLALLWLVGVYLILLGVMRIVAGFVIAGLMRPERPAAA